MARRGENIRKRKDGRWEGRYIKGRKPDGKAIWGYVYARTYPEVKKKQTICKNEAAFHTLTANNLTFMELSQNLESSIFLGVKASTAAHYHYTLQHYILPVLGSYKLKNLNETVFERGLLEIIAPENHSHKTLGHTMAKECLILVRRICRYAVHLHLMRPLDIQIKIPEHVQTPNTVLSKLEQKSVKQYVLKSPTPRKVGLLLMMQMELRIGEVCGIQWKDFDLAHGELYVCRTVKRVYDGEHKTEVLIQEPKTRSSIRKIPVPNSILKLLKPMSKHYSGSDWFLSGNSVRPVEPRCYRKSLHCYLKNAGVSIVRPHALRHTFATTCLQAGCNIKTLSELMGHSSSDITLKRYVHTCWEWKRSEMDRIFG